MTWEELCEKAKEMGLSRWEYYKRWSNVLLTDRGNFIRLAFMKDGSVYIVYEGNFICLIRNRTYGQMLSIMEALR